MSRQYFIETDQFGRVLCRIDCFNPPEDAYQNLVRVNGIDQSATHYINGQFLTQPLQPSPAHYWDEASFSWVLNLDLAKQQARAKINTARDAEEVAGFTAYGKTFDSDKTSQQRILVAANTAQVIGSSFTIDWTCADNSVITLDYAQMLGLPVIMAQAGNALHQKARTLKAQIDAATTLEEINAVVW